jgi:hypothetical protein
MPFLSVQVVMTVVVYLSMMVNKKIMDFLYRGRIEEDGRQGKY